jgi:hypothetical protein
VSEEKKKEGCCCDHDHGSEAGCGCEEKKNDKCCCQENQGDKRCNEETKNDSSDSGEQKSEGEKGAGAQQEEIDYSQFDVELPKPTLIMIATTIAQQAMVSMGILPNPATGKSVFLMHQASYLIDSIDVLFEKTEGNRTEDETRAISNMMSELRMLYVRASDEKARRDAEKK